MKPVAILLLLSISGLLRAEENVLARLDPAWKALEQRTTRLVGQANQRKLLDMAYAQVAADACPGLNLNRTAFESAFGGMVGGAKKDAAAQRRLENEVSTYFGAYTGLLLAESFIDKPAFCKGVEGVKSRKGGPTGFWSAK